MKSNDRLILMVLPVVVVLVGFYFLLISPKQSELNELGDQTETLSSELAAAEAQVAVGERARKSFPKNYTQIVRLGKAVPADGGQANLIYEFAELGKINEVEFRSFAVGGAGGAATPEDAVAGSTPAAGEEGADAPPAPAEPVEAEAAPPVQADATEAVAASLPLGATVGPAGLPLVPYQFNFQGDFFDIADFFAGIDDEVSTTKDGRPVVEGRLVTIDSFALTADPDKGFPALEANFDVTTYIVPPEQGLAAGGTPAGPSPSGLTSAPSTPEE